MNRRVFIKKSIYLSMVASMSGCLHSNQSDIDYSYTDFLYDPEQIGRNRQDFRFQYITGDALNGIVSYAEREGGSINSAYKELAGSIEYILQLPAADVMGYPDTQNNEDDNLGINSTSLDSSYQGFDIYKSGDARKQNNGIAIDPRAGIVEQDPGSISRLIIDTSNRDIEPIHAINQDLGRTIEAAGEGGIVVGEIDPPLPNTLAAVESLNYGEEKITGTSAVIYTDPESVDNTYIYNEGDFSPDRAGAEITNKNIDGSLAVISAEWSYNDLFGPHDSDIPYAGVDYEYNNETKQLTLKVKDPGNVESIRLESNQMNLSKIINSTGKWSVSSREAIVDNITGGESATWGDIEKGQRAVIKARRGNVEVTLFQFQP